jgi:hypothetical protein
VVPRDSPRRTKVWCVPASAGVGAPGTISPEEKVADVIGKLATRSS